MKISELENLDAMIARVRQCEGGQALFREKRGASWLCSVTQIELWEDGFRVHLTPIRRVDTALWRQYPPSPPYKVGGSWICADSVSYSLKRSALHSVGHYREDWCLTTDQAKVQEIVAMAELPKMPVGDILSALRRIEIE